MFIEKQLAMESSPRRGDIGGRQSVEIGRNGKEQERKRDAIAHQRRNIEYRMSNIEYRKKKEKRTENRDLCGLGREAGLP